MLLKPNLLRIIILVFSSLACITQACHTFQNTLVIVNQRDGPQFSKRITGCLERISFSGETVTEVFIRNQNVPIFDTDAVRHLSQLNKVSIWKSRLNEVRPGAFRNLPRLEQVYMNYCNLSNIPKGVFDTVPTLVQVRLHDNRISNIDDEAFGNLENLRRFNISSNRLVTWNPQWFKNSPKLETIDFQFNLIESLPRDAFKNFQILKFVYFGHNEISSIGSDAFIGLTHMQYLGLEHNRLTTISSDVFPNDIRITSLRIEANRLTCMPDELMARVKVKEVAVHGNPFLCDCLDELSLWLADSKGEMIASDGCDHHTLPVCVVPTGVQCANCSGLTDEDLQRFLDAFRRHDEGGMQACARLD